MNKYSTQKEILLVTNNSFAKREWCFKNNDQTKALTAQEQMEELCANGMIYDLLPELFLSDQNTKLYLWQMRPGFSFVQLEYGEFPLATEKSSSLDPHNFLSTVCYN